MRKPPSSASAARRILPATLRCLGAAAPDLPLDVTLVLRCRRSLVLPLATTRRADFAARYGADPADVKRLRALGLRHGMQEQACDMACRSLHWRGSVDAMQQAFGVRLGRYQVSPGGTPFVGCMGAPVLPDPALLAVLGLDQRPVAHPHFRVALAAPAVSYTPLQVAALYAATAVARRSPSSSWAAAIGRPTWIPTSRASA